MRPSQTYRRISSSEPGGINRNKRCHRAASTSPMMMTRFGNLGVEKNSRMARRYTTPATDRGMMENASPWPLNLREQIVNATSKMVPSPYNLRDGVSFTGLPWLSATLALPVSSASARPPFVAPARERTAVPQQAELNRPPGQYRKRDV